MIERSSARHPQASVTGNETHETPQTGTVSVGTARKPSTPPPGPASLGTRALVARHQGDAARRRAEAASVLRTLGQQLPGHGVDLDALAERFASSKHSGESKARVAAQARRHFMQAALRNHPELTGRAITMRLEGQSAEARQLVRAVVSRSGATGMKALAQCEAVLSGIRGFDAEQRRDVLGMVQAGESFAAAVANEKKELARIARTPGRAPAQASRPTGADGAERVQSMSKQVEAAVGRAQADAARWNRVAAKVSEAYRAVAGLDRFAEFATGVAAGTGLPSSLAAGVLKRQVTGSSEGVKEALDAATRAGGYVFGELSGTIAEARKLHLEVQELHDQYGAQNARYRRSLTQPNPEATVDAARRMQALETRMKWKVDAFSAVAKRAARMDAQFDSDTKHAAIHVLLEAAVAGGELAIGEELALHDGVELTKQAAEELTKLAVEGGVAKGVGELAH